MRTIERYKNQMAIRVVVAATSFGTLCCLVVPFLSACTSGSSADEQDVSDPRRIDWTGAASAYSALYEGPLPAGERVRVVITPTVDQTCMDLFTSEDRAQELDFWFMRLDLGAAKAGTYRIEDIDEVGPDQAQVTLQRAVEGMTAVRVAANSGTVTIGEPRWKDGAEITVEVRANFPAPASEGGTEPIVVRTTLMPEFCAEMCSSSTSGPDLCSQFRSL